MKDITVGEFNNLIVRCLKKLNMNNTAIRLYLEAASTPGILASIAQELWIEQVPEDEDTKQFRKQLIAWNKRNMPYGNEQS